MKNGFGFVAVVLAVIAQAVPASGLALLLDADGDGHIDLIELHLGSDLYNPDSTPESVAIPLTCMDQVDNDLDGAVDGAEPGCAPPRVFSTAFPPAGLDVFDSTMSLEGFALETPFGICPLDLEVRGPVVVEREDRTVDTVPVELVAMQLVGIGTLHPLSSCNPGPEPLSIPVTVVEDPEVESLGQIDANPEPGLDFPAESFFDVYFQLDTPLGPLPGGPPGGPAGAPLRVQNTIRGLPPYHSPGNPAFNPDCYTVPGLPHQHCPKPPLDHFKCYRGQFSRFDQRQVFLRDQFLETSAKVLKPRLICNPVSKNREEIFDPGAHLKFYHLAAPGSAEMVAGMKVRVQNQFGPQELLVEELVALALPTQKDDFPAPLALDHFSCYTVDGLPLKVPVELIDQFDEEKVRVVAPHLLCNPVEKTTEDGAAVPIGDRQAHLVCYRIVPQKPVPREVATSNQFGEEWVRVRNPALLCAPSAKHVFDRPGEPPPPRDR